MKRMSKCWGIVGAFLIALPAMAGPTAPPTTAVVIQSVTDDWYTAMPVAFVALGAVLIVFWAWRSIKAYIGRRTGHA